MHFDLPFQNSSAASFTTPQLTHSLSPFSRKQPVQDPHFMSFRGCPHSLHVPPHFLASLRSTSPRLSLFFLHSLHQ